MAATYDAATIRDAIQDLIGERMSGTYSDVVAKKLEGLGIDHTSTLRELRDQHEYWSKAAMAEDSDGGEAVMTVFV